MRFFAKTWKRSGKLRNRFFDFILLHRGGYLHTETYSLGGMNCEKIHWFLFIYFDGKFAFGKFFSSNK